MNNEPLCTLPAQSLQYTCLHIWQLSSPAAIGRAGERKTKDCGRGSNYLASGCHMSRPSDIANLALTSSESLCLELLRAVLKDFCISSIHAFRSLLEAGSEYLLGAYKYHNCVDHMQSLESKRYCEPCIYLEDHLYLDEFCTSCPPWHSISWI